jgi:hypothetical protein
MFSSFVGSYEVLGPKGRSAILLSRDSRPQYIISPASSVVRVGEQRSLRALPCDRSRRRVETDLTFAWEVADRFSLSIRLREAGLIGVHPVSSGDEGIYDYSPSLLNPTDPLQGCGA